MNSKTNNKNENQYQNEDLQFVMSKRYLRPISQVTENIYLGNIYDAFNQRNLEDLGIKKVLSLISDPQLLMYPKEIEHKLIKINDLPRENIIKYFGECLLFIEGDKKVLVHCMAGASRSATIVIAFLMWDHKMTYHKALTLVKDKRFIVFPNPGFRDQLQIFEKELTNNNYDIDKIKFEEIKWEPKSYGFF